MLHHLIAWAVSQRLLVAIALLAFAGYTLIMLPKLELDAFPDVTNVQVAINTEAPGLAAEEVEQLISYPIEAVMYALPDVEQVRSISKTGLSGVTVVFKEGVDVYFARQLVFERLQAATTLIPAGVGTPEMGPNTSGLGQVYQYLLRASPESGYNQRQLRSLNDWLVKLLLMPVDGITDVLSFGGSVRQVQVNLDPGKLLAYQLSQQDVMNALERNNENAGGWYLNLGQEQLVIRGTGWFHNATAISEIEAVPLKTVAGTVVTVADVAQVHEGDEIRQGAVTMSRRNENGELEQLGEVVTGVVLKRMGANTNATITGITERVAMINQALPSGVSFEPFYDQASLINQAVNTVVNALLLAFVFIVIILALFLLDLTATLLVLVSIPIAIALALVTMAQFGLSANLMSLGGLAIAIGMLVDGSVVMVENILKHRQNSTGSINQLIITAGKEVARPIFFASSVILVVFLPLFSFSGVEAKLFQPMAISIMLAIVAAIIVALLVVPALASFLLRQTQTERHNPVLRRLETGYQQLLRYALVRPRWVIATMLVMLLGSAWLIPKLGSEFVPELEEGTINLRVTLAPSASLETALAIAPKLEAVLLSLPEVSYALSKIGRAELGGDPEPVNNIEIYIGLNPVESWQSATDRKALQQLMAEKLAVFPGILLNFSQPIATRVDELLSGVKAQLAIKLIGPELSVLTTTGEQLRQLIAAVPGTSEVALEQIAGESQLLITPNRAALSRYGLAVADIMQVVRSGVGGAPAGQIINGNERYDIYVRLQSQFRNSAEAIADLRILSGTGAWVRLGDVAEVSYTTGAPQIRRDDVQRRIVIQANVEGRDMGSVVADIQQVIATQATLPTGYSVQIGGQFENQQRAQQRLLIVVPLSLALVALLLYFAFNSVAQTLLILVNVPLAVIGGIVSLYLFEQYLSVPSAIGFITLFGVAVLNGVVMVESINLRMGQGITQQEAILQGATARLRPVLMTALTSALGLIPMLLSQGVGAEIQRPLAAVVVGGLCSATLLTLVVLPVLYPYFGKKS
ncbi:efflux RND transporter permease subunit [Pseudoalteromonas fenneropenaei]|uniref:Efflux RND transporter permease subunit n=1 Tax=Pseudoalteromonas fenneropenaei TaxID=1737459 RepID=A0ABV7CPZ8_9GAMM